MPTECSVDLFGFAPVEGRKVVGSFDGGTITSNAGGLLLGQLDRGLGLMRRFADCFTFRQATHDMLAKLSSARSAADQRRWLVWTGVGCVLAGMFLLAISIGPIVSTMPESWHWLERMAANIVGTNQEVAGARLIATTAPDHWRDIVFGYRIVNDNRDAITRCETTAANEARPAGCKVHIDTVAHK